MAYTLIVKKAVYRGARLAAQAPARLAQPGIEKINTQRHDFDDPAISPIAVREGSPTVRLKIEGFNFFDRSQAFFDGHPVPFELKSMTEMELTIDETFLRRPGRYLVQVKNPPPPANPVWEDGTSNNAWLTVSYKDSLLSK